VTALLAIAVLGQSCIQQQVTYAPAQYAQTYQQAYNVQTLVVPVENAETYYLGLVGQAQRQAERQQVAQQATATTDARIEQLTRAVEALQRRIEASEPPLPTHPGQQATNPILPSLGAMSEAAPPPPTIRQASLPGRRHVGLEALTRACAGCHQGAAAAGGGIGLFAANGEFLPGDRDTLASIEAAIISGRMPKRAKSPMSLKEYVAIRDFLNEQGASLALTPSSRKSR
jgi:mono/diheme cytochrome c family protein